MTHILNTEHLTINLPQIQMSKIDNGCRKKGSNKMKNTFKKYGKNTIRGIRIKESEQKNYFEKNGKNEKNRYELANWKNNLHNKQGKHYEFNHMKRNKILTNNGLHKDINPYKLKYKENTKKLKKLKKAKISYKEKTQGL